MAGDLFGKEGLYLVVLLYCAVSEYYLPVSGGFRVTDYYITAVNFTYRGNDYLLDFYDYLYYIYSKSKYIIGTQKSGKVIYVKTWLRIPALLN